MSSISSSLIRTASHIKAHLNILKAKPIERREEEIVKFLLKKALKHIQKYELKGDSDTPAVLKDSLFKDMNKAQFNKLFTSSKE